MVVQKFYQAVLNMSISEIRKEIIMFPSLLNTSHSVIVLKNKLLVDSGKL